MNSPRSFSVSSAKAVMDLVAAAATPLEAKPTGDAVAATIVLAYLSVTDDTSICEDWPRMRKLIEEVSLFLSVWDTQGKAN